MNTTEVTNYVTVNNYIVNRSVNVERVERASNRRFEAVEARSVMRRESSVTPVAAGRQIEQRERRERPIPANATPMPAIGNASGPRRTPKAARDARQDVRDARQDARENVRDARQDNAPNGRGRPNEQVERNPRGPQPQNAQGPQGGNNQADRREERREERIDNRERVQAPQNAGPQQNGNAERNARNPRDNAQGERATNRARAERAVERGGNQNAVQPAGAKPNEAAPVPAGGRAARRRVKSAKPNATPVARRMSRRRPSAGETPDANPAS